MINCTAFLHTLTFFQRICKSLLNIGPCISTKGYIKFSAECFKNNHNSLLRNLLKTPRTCLCITQVTLFILSVGSYLILLSIILILSTCIHGSKRKNWCRYTTLHHEVLYVLFVTYFLYCFIERDFSLSVRRSTYTACSYFAFKI